MSQLPHILVVDDDADLRDLIGDFLLGHGFRVSRAANGDEMGRVLAAESIDLIVLDLMMPGEDGLSLIRRMRGGSGPPIIMLSAMGADHDRIIGLEVGADDYLSKPCNPRELLARVRAVLRRGDRAGGAANTVRLGALMVDLVHRQLISGDGERTVLSDAEFRVLAALIERPQRVVTRDQLIEATRGINSEVFDRAIDVTISRLRKKLGDAEMIRTLRNEGYMLTLKPES